MTVEIIGGVFKWQEWSREMDAREVKLHTPCTVPAISLQPHRMGVTKRRVLFILTHLCRFNDASCLGSLVLSRAS